MTKGRLITRSNFSVFAVTAAVFSAIMLTAALITAAETAEVNDRAAYYERKTEELKKENELLEIQLCMSTDLEEVERYAIEVLGMQHRRGEQVVLLP